MEKFEKMDLSLSEILGIEDEYALLSKQAKVIKLLYSKIYDFHHVEDKVIWDRIQLTISNNLKGLIAGFNNINKIISI